MKKAYKNKEMREKVTVGRFFKVQVKIIKELYNKYKLQTTVIILLSLIMCSAEFIELKFLEYIANSISSASGIGFKEIAGAAGIFLSAILIIRIMSCVYDYINIYYQSNIVFEADKKLINKLSHISYEYYESNAFHEKINLACQASGQYLNAVYGVTQIFRILLMTVVYGIMLAKLTVWYVLVIFASVIISLVVSAYTTDKQLDYWRRHVSPETRRHNYFKAVLDSRVNHQNIQTEQSYPFFSDKYTYYTNRVRSNYLKLNALSFLTEIGTVLLFAITFLFTALIVGKGVSRGQYEIGYFSMVMALLVNFFNTAKSFSLFMLNGNWYVKVLDAYYDVLSLKEGGAATGDAAFTGGCNEEHAAILRNVKYKYMQGQAYALKGISADFTKGSKIAVVGHNGCGKTTMISILLGLLESIEGEFYKNKGAVLTAVMQDFGRYQMTIKENIEIGCGGKRLTEDKINYVLKKVGLYDYVSGLPEGMNTHLGQLENGIELSKGEWQRLAIGRLLVNEDANVWILDEPTAYLDPIAEVDMYRLIFELAEDRLVFFISHRMGFAKMADSIIVMEGGIIAEMGNHAELMKKGGIYAAMYETQKEWYN